jgi:hypothetical protein
MKVYFQQLFVAILAISIIGVSSCSILKSIGQKATDDVSVNSCGILVFKDSIEYGIVYDYLEYQQNEFAKTTTSSTVDEEKPLTDFEAAKHTYSYRSDILHQEDVAEAANIDLSVSPVPQILEDDEILQTLLNKDRMVIIDNVVYYYYDDCTLFKFPATRNCQSDIATAKSYFENYLISVANHVKPPFTYEKVDICEEESSFRVANLCQEMRLQGCVQNQCNPYDVDFVMSFPNYYNTTYTLTSFRYSLDNGVNYVTLSPSAATNLHSNSCGFSLGEYGFDVHAIFPTLNTIYSIIMEGTFSYSTGSSTTATCTSLDTVKWKVGKSCFIKANPIVHGLTVFLDAVDNPCTPGSDAFTFRPLDGSPVTTGIGPNSIKLQYLCQGLKTLEITYSASGCTIVDTLSYRTTDPSLCCALHKRTNCTRMYPNPVNTSDLDKIKVKLKERCNRVVAIARNFHRTSSTARFKRTRTSISMNFTQSLYYEKNTCECNGVYPLPVDVQSIYGKNARRKFKLFPERANIESSTGISYYNFKHTWSRKNNLPWGINVKTNEISPQQFQIDCPNTGHTCN